MRRVPMRRLPAALAAAGLLAGCEGLGGGSAPTGVTISLNGLDVEDYQTYECAAFQLAATAVFNDDPDNGGDVSDRAQWTSSNPGVIDVSNGDIETEPGSGQVFPAGTVIVRSPGNALIRADYIGFSDGFSVAAKPISSARITPELTRMAPASTQTFALEVVFDDGDAEADLTSSAVWSLANVGAPATISDTSTVTVVTDPLDRPFLLEARLYTCEWQAQLSLQVSAVQELRLSYEQDTTLPVPLGHGDQIRAEAVFEDVSAPVQNLSDQVLVEQVLGDDDEAATGLDEYLTVEGLVADVPVQFSVTYEPLDLSVLTRVYTFADVEVLSLRVDPARSQLYYPDTLQLQAYGLFEDGYERPVRRSVTWSSLNEDLATVVSGGWESGLVTPLELEGEATIEATTSNSEGEVSAEADIEVYVD